VGRKTSGVMLAVKQLTVPLDVKDSASAFDQFDGLRSCLFNCFRQTDGLGRVVSLYAVGNTNRHIELLC